MGELVTTVTKFKAKKGSENQLIEELRSFDNSSSKTWQILSLGDNEYAAINTYESIENRTEDVASGLDWLDSITPLNEMKSFVIKFKLLFIKVVKLFVFLSLLLPLDEKLRLPYSLVLICGITSS